jgi:hypothetical protein
MYGIKAEMQECSIKDSQSFELDLGYTACYDATHRFHPYHDEIFSFVMAELEK